MPNDVPDELQLERATDGAAEALKALAGFVGAIDKLRADLGMEPEPELGDASSAIRDAGMALQLVGETVAERGPSEASRLLEASGAADDIRSAAERIRAATRALRESRKD
jgi:hypothetical protein